MEIGYKKSQCIENNIAQNGVKSTVLRKTKKNLKKMKKVLHFYELYYIINLALRKAQNKFRKRASSSFGRAPDS